MHPNDPRHHHVERSSSHRDGDVQAAGTDRQHGGAAGGRRVAVRPQKNVTRGAEALQVDLMADAVARPGKVDAVLGGYTLEEAVVVGVLEPCLEHVVIDVGHGQLGPHPGDAHRLELQIGHGAGSVLGEGLVHANADLAAGREFAGY